MNIKPICPKCGREARSTKTKYGIRNFCCDLWSWGIGYPLMSKKVHSLRNRAHVVFDEIWKSKRTSRSKAYSMLSKELNIKQKYCHIKLMEEEQLNQVINKAVPNILAKTMKCGRRKNKKIKGS